MPLLTNSLEVFQSRSAQCLAWRHCRSTPSVSKLSLILCRVFQDNQLSGTIPESIYTLPNLIQLYVQAFSIFLTNNSPLSSFQNNQLSGTLSESVSSLSNLQYLYEDFRLFCLLLVLTGSSVALQIIRSLELFPNQSGLFLF